MCMNINMHAFMEQSSAFALMQRILRWYEDPVNTTLVCKAISGTVANTIAKHL